MSLARRSCGDRAGSVTLTSYVVGSQVVNEHMSCGCFEHYCRRDGCRFEESRERVVVLVDLHRAERTRGTGGARRQESPQHGGLDEAVTVIYNDS